MNTITFGKNRYHLHREMESWCRENIGKGIWTYGPLEVWEDIGSNLWVMWSTFGNTTFAFRDPKHLTLFVLRWS